VAVDGSGNAVVTGSFQAAIDFGGGSQSSNGGYDAYLVKVAGTTGAQVWAKHFGDAANQYGYAVAAGPGGEVVGTGFFLGSVNFGAGSLVSAGAGDGFLVSVSP